MNFQEFRHTLGSEKVFSTQDIAKEWRDFNFNNLVNWQKKGYIQKIRNKWYTFTENLNREEDLFFLANRIHQPSYISLHSALRYYNWIPESVFSITSVTTAKPNEWHTPVGTFSYRSVKPSLFFGYYPVEWQDAVFNIAEPEKLTIDLLYFFPQLSTKEDFEGWRLNKSAISEQLDLKKLNTYLEVAKSETLSQRAFAFKSYLSND